MNGARAPTVALLPWGDVIEDYLDAIGVSLEQFATEMTGGWLFGYMEALRLVGIRSVLVCVSARRTSPDRFRHKPTGATVRILPAPRAYRLVRRRVSHPYAVTLEESYGRRPGDRMRFRGARRVIRDILAYLATPPVALARVLREEQCDAVLCQEYEFARFDVAVGIGRLMRLPVFASFQGGQWQVSRIEHVLRPRTIRAARGLIVPSGAEASRIAERYGESGAPRVARIFNPLDVREWVAPPRAPCRVALGIPESAEVAVWHGRVDRWVKGLDVLLDAWWRVRAAHPGRDRRLLLVGTGVDAPWIRTQLDSRNDGSVLWIDRYVLDRGEMRRYLAAADVYVFPSRHEGFPVAPLEAMACGLPIVAADASGISDILARGEQDGGIIVPRTDVEALAGALGELLDDPPRRAALGRNARARIERAFSLEAVGGALREVLFPGWDPPQSRRDDATSAVSTGSSTIRTSASSESDGCARRAFTSATAWATRSVTTSVSLTS